MIDYFQNYKKGVEIHGSGSTNRTKVFALTC